VPDPVVVPTYTSEYYRLILAALKKNQSLTRALNHIIEEKGTDYDL
jgi:hypothetical protein